MPNKLKDIFSDDMFNINSALHFIDDDAYKGFLSALETASAEGRIVPVEGVTSVDTSAYYQGANFPLEEHTNISEFYVGPAMEPVTLKLDVDGEEKIITLLRSYTKDKIILQSNPNSIIVFNLTLLIGKSKHTLNYKVQFDKANNIKEIADSFSLAYAFLMRLYKQENPVSSDNSVNSLADIKNYFRCYKSFYKRLNAIQNKLGLSIAPCLLNNIPMEERQDIDELYLLLFENKVIRLNSKITSTGFVPIDNNHKDTALNIGDKIVFTFLGTIDFTFLGQTATLHTANLLVNAFIKDIKENTEDATKVWYGDTDSKPMYISFSAFQTEEDAKMEAETILQHDKKYINAPTLAEYIYKLYAPDDQQNNI